MTDALRQAGEVELPSFTTEELTAIGAEDVSIVQRQVTNGGAVMPAFKGKLTDAQIRAVARYVSSVAGK